tara:strand:+ start:143996 stop:144424 length:429 start_codon:yes stop_codon:yes gene_type:complete
MKSGLLLFFALFPVVVSALEINEERVRFNYQMFCQGCHAPGGASVESSVPRMQGHVGTFLKSQRGREFLVRVPGSATSALDDVELAEVLNWIVLEFSGPSLEGAFEPYTAAEVGKLRQQPLNEVVKHRALVLADIADAQTRE